MTVEENIDWNCKFRNNLLYIYIYNIMTVTKTVFADLLKS